MLKKYTQLCIFLIMIGILVGCSLLPSVDSTEMPPETTPENELTATPAKSIDVIATEEVILSTAVMSTPAAEGDLPPLPEANVEHTASGPGFRYFPQLGTPLQMISPFHTECDWTGVGGQVFDINGQPDTNVIIQLGGTLNSQPVNQVTMTSWATQWGPGGYEFSFGSMPVSSTGTLWLQLYTTQWQIVSNRVTFDTSAACDKNFVMINFNQFTYFDDYQEYLPLMSR